MSMDSSKRPNVIIVLSDDQGYGDYGFMANPWLQTPNLDKLHDESVSLTDFHTSPMCAPTRAALMSGRYPDRVGVWSTLNGCYIMRKEAVTIAQTFQDADYHTGMFGKWHLGDNYPYRPQDKGFDKSVSFGGGVIGEVPDYWNNDYFDDVYRVNGERTSFDGYCTDIWMDEAIKEMERLSELDNEPFFFYIANNAPHGPFNVESRFSKRYRDMGLPENRANFYGMIENIDDNMGKLESALDRLGIKDNTIVLYLGDNGTSVGVSLDQDGYLEDGFNGGLRGKKCDAFEGGHRNCCLIRWPDGKLYGGYKVHGISFHMDLFPTLLSLCGLPIPEKVEFDGMDIGDWLSVPESTIEDRMVVIHNMQLEHPLKYKDYCVLTNEWRLVQMNKYRLSTPLLYSAKDTAQAKDVLSDNDEVYAELRGFYDEWWNKTSLEYNNHSAIELCGAGEPLTVLTCHSWRGSSEMTYNQIHVRKGIEDKGYWAVEVKKTGYYRIQLRRWPIEADVALQSSVPEIGASPNRHLRPEGKVYDIVKAGIRTNLISAEEAVEENASYSDFLVYLDSETNRLEGWFRCEDELVIGSYYAYISYVSKGEINEIISM